jgi:hypothetical protein
VVFLVSTKCGCCCENACFVTTLWAALPSHTLQALRPAIGVRPHTRVLGVSDVISVTRFHFGEPCLDQLGCNTPAL